jgi:hypothetical protein
VSPPYPDLTRALKSLSPIQPSPIQFNASWARDLNVEKPRIAIHDRQKRAPCPCYYDTPAFHHHYHSSPRRPPRHPPFIPNAPLLGRQKPRHGRRPPPHCRRSDQGGCPSGARVLRDACLALAITLRHCPRPFFFARETRRDETRRVESGLGVSLVAAASEFLSSFLSSHFTFAPLLTSL